MKLEPPTTLTQGWDGSNTALAVLRVYPPKNGPGLRQSSWGFEFQSRLENFLWDLQQRSGYWSCSLGSIESVETKINFVAHVEQFLEVKTQAWAEFTMYLIEKPQIQSQD